MPPEERIHALLRTPLLETRPASLSREWMRKLSLLDHFLGLISFGRLHREPEWVPAVRKEKARLFLPAGYSKV